MSIADSVRALGCEGLPRQIVLDGHTFGLVSLFKHTFVSAVGLYAADTGQAVVLKCYRSAPLLGVATAWAGRLMAVYEAAILERLSGVQGVPRLRCRYGATRIVRDYVPGVPLTRHSRVTQEFFDDLFRVLGEVHRRGVACVDLEKASNIILGQDGLPHLIDFQAAFYWPEGLLGGTLPARCLRRWFQRADLYHARKHFRRLMRSQLSKEELARLRRRPWFVRLANAMHSPFKKARRWILRKGL
jgi:hypothetical protein